MDASINPQNNKIIEEDDDLRSLASSLSDVSSDSIASSLDFTEDATSTHSSSSSDQPTNEPLYQMSSLMEQLPFKRGLSRHFQGKSQSFTSLSNVRCLEDLAKPENPYTKRLKSCKSYGGDLDSERSYSSTKASSRTIISKKASRGSCPSLNAKRNNSSILSKPPIPPHRDITLCNRTPLFA